MVDHVALRSALREFLGKELFMEVVRHGCGNRLLFWQEKDWARFIAANPLFDVSLSELTGALRICFIHGGELLPCEIEIFHGCLDYSSQYTRDRSQQFPYAAQDPISTEGRRTDAVSLHSWYCPGCRSARAAYLANRPRDMGPRRPLI